MDELLRGPNYNSEYNLIINCLMYEYDLSKANINALYSRGVISKELYDTLYTSDKFIREKHIGLMIRENNNIYKEIQAGIIDAKKQLLISNNIDKENVISIKNDAVFTTVKCNYTKFGLMDFKLKNTYTLFIKINKYEFWYYYNPITGEEKLDVKGINDSKLDIHRNYFLDFLLELFNRLQQHGVIEAINLLHAFSIAYINRQLEIGYYRKFNSDSKYDVIVQNTIWSTISADNLSIIDIRYNYEILRDLYGVLIEYYFRKEK